MFSYKRLTLIEEGDMGLWVVIYTEGVVLVCVALQFFSYGEYCLWYVPPDIIFIVREICMTMEISLRSSANVREMLARQNITDLAVFLDLPDVWRDRTIRYNAYHLDLSFNGSYHVYHELWCTQNIDFNTTWSRSNATNVVPGDIPLGRIHYDLDIERTPREKSRDSDVYAYGSVAPCAPPVTYHGRASGPA